MSSQGSYARGPYRRGIKTRNEIIDSATIVFAQHGFTAGTLRQIAEGVGVSPAAIARHFATKEDLFVAVLHQSDQRNADELFGDAEGLNFFDHSTDLVEHNTRNRGMVELLLTVATESTNEDHPGHALMTARYALQLDSLVAKLQEARASGSIRDYSNAELELEARGYIALMDGLELQWLLDPTFDLVSAWKHHYGATRERWTHRAS